MNLAGWARGVVPTRSMSDVAAWMVPAHVLIKRINVMDLTSSNKKQYIPSPNKSEERNLRNSTSEKASRTIVDAPSSDTIPTIKVKETSHQSESKFAATSSKNEYEAPNLIISQPVFVNHSADADMVDYEKYSVRPKVNPHVLTEAMWEFVQSLPEAKDLNLEYEKVDLLNKKSIFLTTLPEKVEEKVMEKFQRQGITQEATPGAMKTCRNALLKDAEEHLENFVIPPRPPIPELESNADAEEVIDILLSNSPGVTVGENGHHSIGSKKWLIDNMEKFAAKGVDTIFLEHLFADEHQSCLDEYFDDGSEDAQISYRLRSYLSKLEDNYMGMHGEFNCPLNSIQRKQYAEKATIYNFTEIIKKAKKCGIRIEAFDCRVSYMGFVENTSAISQNNLRHIVMNYLLIKKTKSYAGQGKWLAFVGNAHVGLQYRGVLSVAELAGTLAVCVGDPLTDHEPSSVQTDVLEIKDREGNGIGIRADIVITQSWISKAASKKSKTIDCTIV
jgi:hypothetical protein